MRLAALVFVVLGVSLAAADEPPRTELVVVKEEDGVLLVLNDPEARRLVLYRHNTSGLRLEAVRNYSHDLQFQEWNSRGTKQRPSVKDQREAAEKTKARTAQDPTKSVAEVLKRELEVQEVRVRVAAMDPDKEPTVRGVPLSEHLRSLERKTVEFRLKVAERASKSFLRDLLELIRAEISKTRRSLAICEAQRRRLEPDHGGVQFVERELERLRARLEALEALEKTETR